MLKREEILEHSGSEHYVTPLDFDLKENIYFSFWRNLCGTCPIILCGGVAFISFLFSSYFCLAITHIKQQNTSKHT